MYQRSPEGRTVRCFNTRDVSNGGTARLRNFETTGSLTIDKRVGDTPIEVADIADQVRHSSLQLGCSFKQPRAYFRFCLAL
jgi:hypothetical protein